MRYRVRGGFVGIIPSSIHEQLGGNVRDAVFDSLYSPMERAVATLVLDCLEEWRYDMSPERHR